MSDEKSEEPKDTGSTLSQIRNLSASEVVLAVSLFLATVATGALVIFSFDKGTFIELDTFKLLVLSTSVTLPVLAVNVLLTEIAVQNLKSTFSDNLIMAGILSSLVFYPPLLIRRFSTDLTFNGFLGWLLLFEVIAVISMGVFLDKTGNKGKAKNKVSNH